MYTDKFKKEVRECLPPSKTIDLILDKSDPWLHIYLPKTDSILFADIMKAKTLDELKEAVILAERVNKLHEDWFNEEPERIR